MRHILTLTLIIFFFQFLACNPKDLWENDNEVKDVSTVESMNNTCVEVVFNYEVEETSSEDPANYSIEGLDVLEAARDDTDNTKVMLITSSQAAVEYTIVITNVERDDGELVDNTEDSDTFMGDALPYVVSITRDLNNIVTVVFSEDMETVGIGSAANYLIYDAETGGTELDVISAKVVSDTSVYLLTDNQEEIEYILTISNVMDLTGNPLDDATSVKSFNGDGCPALVDVVWQPNRIVDVVFSEAVDEASAENLNNYAIDGLDILDAVLDDTDNSIVHLETDYQDDVTYTLTISNVTDLTGNAIDPSPAEDTFEGNPCPYISDVHYNGDSMVDVVYSEDMNSTSILIITNYQLWDYTASSYITITYVSFAAGEVHLTLGSPFECGHEYELTVSDTVEDIDGNYLIPPYVISFEYL